MKRKEFRGVMGIAMLLYLLFTQMAYGQEQKGDFTVSGGTSSFADNVLTVSSGEVTVSSAVVTSQTIELTGGTLILDGVKISSNVSPIKVVGTAEISLGSGKNNSLTATNVFAAGIHVPPTSQVTFTGNNGELTVANTELDPGKTSSTAIGAVQGEFSCGTIIFDLEGSITAQGGARAAAIGTCNSPNESIQVNGAILIRNGTIDAKGGAFAAGIGTGPDGIPEGKVTVTIEGGNVKAAIIGSSNNTVSTVDIFLLGGYVDADIHVNRKSNSSPNTFIIGPDVTIPPGRRISGDYDNGFVFSGSPKTATVKGNPEFPAGKEMTINEGEKLTIPSGTTLINNGKIINNGTIEGDGIIVGNLPLDKDGNKLYKVSYDLNGGNGTKPVSLYLKEGPLTLPSYSGITKDGYTCLGWNTTRDATEALVGYTVEPGANTLYAIWKIVDMELSNTAKEITGTVGMAFSEVDLSANVSNKEAVLGVTFTVKQDNSLPEGFILAADGKLTCPNMIKTAASNSEVLVTITPGNGAPTAEFTLTFNIAKGTLVVTPVLDQTIYAGEYPAYTLPEYITGEAHVTGNLAVVDGVITQGNLALTDKGRENHDAIELSADNIRITQKAENAADAVAEIVPSGSGINHAGWYRNPVTLKAPVGFDIWVESISKTKAAPTLKNMYRLTEDGIYTSYRLVRTATNADYLHEIDIKLDQTAPESITAPTINNLKATFTLMDATSGIASYSYDLDGAGPSEMKIVDGAPKEYKVEVMAPVGSHTITFTICDVAGNETTSVLKDFTLTAPTVVLPAVEGATTNPVAGIHEVDSSGSFLFYLTPSEGYDEASLPIVRTDRGETIEPRQSDGAYIIKNVSQNVVVLISGIVPDVPTGIADINSETDIRVVAGTLQITVPQTADAWITDMSGRILRTLKLTPGITRVEGLHSGIYIVKINGQKGRKVIVN